MDVILWFGSVLILQQALHPLIVLVVMVIRAEFHALLTVLVLPVCRHAEFGHLVHFLCADLHLERVAVIPHDDGVQRLITIRFRVADVVLEVS